VHHDGAAGAYGRELNDFEQLSRGQRNARWAGFLRIELFEALIVS
jgi:hypothetical protein